MTWYLVILVVMATPLWTAHPECPEHVKVQLEVHVRSFPSSFLFAPINDEVFKNSDICQERLQGWTLSQSFVVVCKSGNMKQTRPRFDFRCIHHGDNTLDTRHLEQYVERGEENRITSRYKQETTSTNVRSCSYMVYLAYKQVGKCGSDIYDLVLSISSDFHSHLMTVNPLRYKKEYVKMLLVFLSVLTLNRSLRTTNISYSVTLRVLEQIDFSLN